MAEVNSNRPPLAFGDEYLLDGKPNKYIPFFVRALMTNFEVRRILVDQGSSIDIIFLVFLTKLGILEDLTPYRGTYLSGFNGSNNRPLGYIKLLVTFGDDPLTRTVKTPFLVLPCKSIYNCIIDTPTLG